MTQFQYQARSPEAWEKRASQRGGTFSGYALDEFQVFGPKKGDNWIRILPPTWANPNHYGFDLWLHYSVGPDNGTVVCLQKMKNQVCPICTAHAKAEAAGREDADDFKPTRRVLVWILNRAEEQAKPNEYIPQLWAMPWTFDRDLTKICKDRQTGELYVIDHPDQGYDISFERDESGTIPKYVGIQISRRPSSVAPRFLDYITQHPLPTTLAWRTAEEVQQLFEGAGSIPDNAPPAQPGQAPAFNTTPTAFAPPPFTPPVAAVPPPPVVVAPPPPPPPPVPVAIPFTPHWTQTPCAVCGQLTYEFEPRKLVCQQQHVQDALPLAPPVPTGTSPVSSSVPSAPVPTQPGQAAPGATPPSDMFAPRQVTGTEAPTPTAAQPVSGRAAQLKERFTTGRS